MHAKSLNMTPEEYLREEESSSCKHEFVNGQVYAMVGASEAHNVIAVNLVSALRHHLRGTGCRAFMADMKVRVEASNCFYYPDVMVTCEQFNAKSVYKTAPVLICEILSPSTAETDLREKLNAYRQLPSLREYLVVHQDEPLVERYTKNSSGKWERTTVKSGELTIDYLASKEFSVPIDVIYEEVEF